MDLFGDIDDISSESDDDNQLPIPGQPVVSTITTLYWSHCSEVDGSDFLMWREDMDNWGAVWNIWWMGDFLSDIEIFWVLEGIKGTAQSEVDLKL